MQSNPMQCNRLGKCNQMEQDATRGNKRQQDAASGSDEPRGNLILVFGT